MAVKLLTTLLALFVLSAMAVVVHGLASADITNVAPTNASYTSSGNGTLDFTFSFVNDTEAESSCTLYIDDVAVFTNETVANNTATTFNANTSFGSDGTKEWYIQCINTSATVNGTFWYFVYDTTDPSAVTIAAPAAGYESSASAIVFNFSAVDALGASLTTGNVTANVTIDDVMNYTHSIDGTGADYVATSVTFADGAHTWNITIFDSAGNTNITATRTFTVDTTAPTLADYTVVNVSSVSTVNNSITVNYTYTDSLFTQSAAWLNIYDANDVLTDTLTSYSANATSGLYLENQFDITPADISNDGYFYIEPLANDTLGNTQYGTNQTNYTKNTLYAGWNLIAATENITLQGIKNYSSAIDSVSVQNFSVSSLSWITYVDGTSTNADHAVTEGDAIFVNVTGEDTVGLLRKYASDVENQNMSLVNGWNVATAYNNTGLTLTQICAEDVENSTADILTTTYVDMTSGSRLYKNHVCTYSTTYATETIPMGAAYWINVNDTTTYYRGR